MAHIVLKNQIDKQQLSKEEAELIHSIDMEYLINPEQHKKITEKYYKSKANNVEIRFYRKRILQLTRDLIAGNIANSNLEYSFGCYLNEAIKYFKFIDKKDIIQEDYSEVNNEQKRREGEKIKRKTSNNLFSIQETAQIDGKNADELLMNLPEPKGPSIENFIKINKTHVDQEEKIMPKQRNINLKDPKLKKKGVKKSHKKKNIKL